MPDDPEIIETELVRDTDDHEEGGGPVKTFLEHLEDLRWTIIRSVIAILLGIIVCLSAGNFIIGLIKRPLIIAQQMRPSKDPLVVLTLGTNILGRMPLSRFPVENTTRVTNALGLVGTNDIVLRLAPVVVGTNTLLALVTDPTPPADALYGMRVDLKTYSPGGGFTIAIQIAMFGGLTLSAPFVLFFLGQFILPALHVHEKKFLYRVSAFASALFFGGVAFCYFVLLPITLGTTAAFSNWLGFGADEWRADEFISFSCWFLLGMGVSFELPLVLLTLVKIGLLDVKALSRYRSYFYVGILVIAGFVTPDGNPVNMLLMAAPLLVLYEATVVIAWFWARSDAKKAALAGEK